jgi:hypothetical protein
MKQDNVLNEYRQLALLQTHWLNVISLSHTHTHTLTHVLHATNVVVDDDDGDDM